MKLLPDAIVYSILHSSFLLFCVQLPYVGWVKAVPKSTSLAPQGAVLSSVALIVKCYQRVKLVHLLIVCDVILCR